MREAKQKQSKAKQNRPRLKQSKGVCLKDATRQNDGYLRALKARPLPPVVVRLDPRSSSQPPRFIRSCQVVFSGSSTQGPIIQSPNHPITQSSNHPDTRHETPPLKSSLAGSIVKSARTPLLHGPHPFIVHCHLCACFCIQVIVHSALAYIRS